MWHLWTAHMLQIGSTFSASLLSFSPFHSFLSIMLFTSSSVQSSLFPSLNLPLPLFCSRHGPLLSYISSHNSSGKTSLNLTPRMWVHTSKSSNNTEILQIRSCQIKGGISGAHPSLRRGQLKACLRPDLHVKIHLMIQTTSQSGTETHSQSTLWDAADLARWCQVRCGHGWEILLACRDWRIKTFALIAASKCSSVELAAIIFFHHFHPKSPVWRGNLALRSLHLFFNCWPHMRTPNTPCFLVLI